MSRRVRLTVRLRADVVGSANIAVATSDHYNVPITVLQPKLSVIGVRIDVE